MTGLAIKHDVLFRRGPAWVQPVMVIAAMCAEAVFRKYGVDCVITSALDGRHKPGSKHYDGHAMDFRTRDLSGDSVKRMVRTEIAERLGPQYDVVLERTHLHVEYDSK